MCTLCLVRVHCQHYSAPARLVVILREICNLLIEMVEPSRQGSTEPAPPGACQREGGVGRVWGPSGGDRETPNQGPSEAPAWGWGVWARRGLCKTLTSPQGRRWRGQDPPRSPRQTACTRLSQTRSVLTPEDVLKGLQGEMDEVLGGIRLSIATIEQLFQSYRTYCCNLAPTLCPVGAGPVRGCPARPHQLRSLTAPLASRRSRSSGTFSRPSSSGGLKPSCTGSGPSR